MRDLRALPKLGVRGSRQQALGGLYGAALHVALTDPDPLARRRAGRAMTSFATGMIGERRDTPEMSRGVRGTLDLRGLIVAALDHRIYEDNTP